MKKMFIFFLAVILSSVQPISQLHAQDEDYDPQHTLLALNMAIVSIQRILDTQSKIILNQEYNNIIGNIHFTNVKPDSAIRELYQQIMETIKQKRLNEIEAKQVKSHYDLEMQKLLVSSLSNISLNNIDDNTEISSFWGNVVNMLYTCVASYFRYQAGQIDILDRLETSLYTIQSKDIASFHAMQDRLFYSSWELMYSYHIPDEYRLRQNNIQKFYELIGESGNVLKKLRQLVDIENNFRVYPPYWYYRARTALEAHDQVEAEKCFDAFDKVWRHVLTKDPYKLEVTKYRLISLVKKGIPDSSDFRQKVMDLLDVMEIHADEEDWMNNLFAGLLHYAIDNTNKGMNFVRRNVDNNYETDISSAMLYHMENGVKLSELASAILETLRERNLKALIPDIDEADNSTALALADYFDDREGAIEALEALQSAEDKNPMVFHALRLIEARKADVLSFSKVRTLAAQEADLQHKMPALYPKVLKLVKSYADKDNTTAQIFLADMYNYGWGGSQDITQAMNYYLKSGNKNDIYSQFMYINLVLNKLQHSQVSADISQVSANISQADAEKYFNLGLQHHLAKRYTEAFECFMKSADNGNGLAGACYMIGEMLSKGQGRPQDIESAISWYQNAADKGHDGAIRVLKDLGRYAPLPRDLSPWPEWSKIFLKN